VNAHGAPYRLLIAVLRWLARIELAAVSLMLVAALLISAYSIVFRNLGYSTGDWALTLPEVLLVWMTFIGCGSLVTRNEHVAADFLVMLFPRSLQKWVNFAVLGIAFISLLPAFWGSWFIVERLWNIGMRNSELLNVPQAVLSAAIPLGVGLCLLHIIGKCLELLMASPDGDAK